jgi:hypothetical protein
MNSGLGHLDGGEGVVEAEQRSGGSLGLGAGPGVRWCPVRADGRPLAVTAALFTEGGFFLAADKVQVKYAMLRAHLLDGVPVTAAAHGYSRAGCYLVAAAFEQAG